MGRAWNCSLAVPWRFPNGIRIGIAPMPKLMKRLIDSVQADAGSGEIFLWDSDVKGFGLRVKPTGVKSFVLKYRVGSLTKRHTISKVGSPYTVDQAREIAADLLRDIRRGGDPGAEKRQARDAMTVADICAWYLEQARVGGILGRRGTRIKVSTLAMDKSRIETHVKPLIGNRQVDNLSLDDMERFQTEIVTGKTAKARKGRGGATTGGTAVASRTVGMVQTIFEHAKRKRLIKINPASGVKKHADGKQRRFLSLEEISRLGSVMREDQKGDRLKSGPSAIRFLLLTGLRRMEALALPWAWVDGKGRCIRFEDTKSGAQLRPIGADAVKLLESLSPRDGCPWVFPADRGEGHYIGLPKLLERLCTRAGLAGVTVHVLRHSFAAAAAEMGYSELTIAGLLGHTVASVTGRYAHVPDRALVSAADAISIRISAALDGRKAADIVQIGERAFG